MSEFDNISLTLDLEEETPQAPETALAEKPAEAEIPQVVLSERDKQMIADFVPKINLRDSTIVSNYGSGAQKKIADFSETMLGSVRTKDLGEVGEMLAGVVTELKSFDEEEEQKGIFGFFKKTSNKLTAMKAKYNKAEANVNQIAEALETHQVQLLKDSAMLDKMYDMNLAYYKELCLYIMAGKEKLHQVREVELKELMEKAALSGASEDAQAANDLAALCNRFEKKLHDLELTRMISIQMGPQIRLVQNNDTLMVDKIQSTLVNTIPLWKSQMVLALGVTHSQQAAEAQRGVTELTNQMLRKNAETLKMATVETAKESERGIVDIETLRATNESLISTLDEVMRIQQEGRQKRAEAEVELRRLEGDLKQKLLSIRN